MQYTASVARVELPDRFNLAEYFVNRHLVEGRGDRTALIAGGQRISYRELSGHIGRVGNGLRRLGLEEEQRVLLVLPDIPEFAAAYFGTMKIGAVPVPTSTALRAGDYAYFLEESRARIAIVHSTLLAEFGPAIAGHHFSTKVIVCGDLVDGYISWDQLMESGSRECETAPTSKEDAAFWLWTSGSTGRPKAAVHSHQDWVYCCEYYACGILEIRADDVTFSSSKLFHAYGLGNGLMFPFYVGAAAILYPGKPAANVILEYAETNRPTLFFSVPTLYAAMLQEAGRGSGYDLGSVRLAVSAGEPLPADLFRRWKQRFGVEILDGIGSTEVLHIYLSARAGEVRPGSTGRAVPGYELALIDSTGQPAVPGTIGDLMVAGPSTAQVYWNRKALSQERMRGCWFFTGDKFSVDQDGYYWYAGRSDDMFKVSGQWVSPIEVECTLVEHPGVLEAAVIAFEAETGLYTPMAFVVPRDGYAGLPDLAKELQEFVKQRITPYKYPRHVEFLRELPKTAAGKVMRYKLREMSRRTAVSKAST
jgi:benzoate-CoA ligase